jgi:hypothetical protein
MVTLLIVALFGALVLAQAPAGGNAAGKGGKREAPKQVTLTGTVKDLTEPGKEAKGGKGERGAQGENTCTLVTDAGEVRLGLAPTSYLTKVGLTLKDGAKITMNGLQFANRPVVAVIDVTLDGKSYTLRDAKGQPMWGPFEGIPVTTIQGTVIDVITEAPKADANKPADAKPAEGDKPADAAKPERPRPVPVAILVQTDKDAVRVELGPQDALDRLGFAPAKDMKVSVTGWQQEKGKKDRAIMAAQSVTIDGKTITLRDDKGRPAWQRQGGNRPERGQGGKGGGRRGGKEAAPPTQGA